MLILCADVEVLACLQICQMKITRPGQRSRMGNELPILRD